MPAEVHGALTRLEPPTALFLSATFLFPCMTRYINTFTKHHAFSTNAASTKVGIEDRYAEQVMVMDSLDSIHECENGFGEPCWVQNPSLRATALDNSFMAHLWRAAFSSGQLSIPAVGQAFGSNLWSSAGEQLLGQQI